jgi:hypothetical protein
MGEYAEYHGKEVKIGTCEDMLYLRYDQRELVKRMPHSLDPADEDTQKVIRFRFPWPDEDRVEPGSFENPDRAIHIPGLVAPEGTEHGHVQFVASAGYNVCLPCPEATPDPRIHRNGHRGAVLLVQQAVRAGKLVSIFMCGGCGARFRIEDVEHLKDALHHLRTDYDRPNAYTNDPHRAKFYATIADRIEAGYTLDLTPVSA